MNPSFRSHACHCGCCAPTASANSPLADLSRRQFLYAVGALSSLPLVGLDRRVFGQDNAPQRRPLHQHSLRVQPVLTYSIPQRREATSWREWGGLQTEADATAEKQRIRGELEALAELSEQLSLLRAGALQILGKRPE